MIRRSLSIPALAILALGASLGAVAAARAAADSGADWQLSGPFGGTATSVAIDPQHPDILLAGAMSSLLFKTEDAGAHWTLLNFPKRTLSQVTALLIDPSDPNHYLAGMMATEGAGLFESNDAGNTWAPVKDITDFGVRALAYAPGKPTRFVAGTMRGVMLSDDCGKTWKRISDPQNGEMQGITSVAIDTADPNVIYAGTAHLPWKTTDGGKTWESIHEGMIDDSDVFSIYVDHTAPANILASACSGIYSSDNRGELWHKLLGIPNTSRRTHVVREDPANSSIIYAGTTSGLFKSVNSGKLWKTVTNTPVNALAFNAASPYSMYLAFEYEGIGKSNDQGDVVELVNNGFVDRRITAVASSGKRLLALEGQEGDSSGLFITENQGDTWTQFRSAKGIGGVHLRTIVGFAGENRTLLAATGDKLYKSVDGGALWKPLPVRRIIPPPPAPEKPKTQTPTRTRQSASRTRATTRRPAPKPKPVIKEIFPSEINGLYSLKNGDKDLLFATTDLGLLKSDDLGEHWLLIDVPQSAGVANLYPAPNGDGRLLLEASGGLYVSKDFGDHWTPVPFPLQLSDFNAISFTADAPGAWLAATRLGLYRSTDEGATWSVVKKGLPLSTVGAVAYSVARQAAYASEYGQLYESKDGGESWSLLHTELPGLRIRQLWVPDAGSTRLYAITSDLGILFRN